MDDWISTKELADGIANLPVISIITQNNLRAKRKLTYTKIGTRVVYKREWIMDYLDSNIKKAQTRDNK